MTAAAVLVLFACLVALGLLVPKFLEELGRWLGGAGERR